jgi:hypothetical protein
MKSFDLISILAATTILFLLLFDWERRLKLGGLIYFPIV